MSLNRDFGGQDCPADLHGVVGVLKSVRQRILANTFLQGLTKWWTWIFAALLVIGAISTKLAGAMISAVILACLGAALILTWIVRTRLSIYETACRLDSAASLQDRISTSIFLADIAKPDEMMQYQRRDAVARLGKVEPRGLFPVRMPTTAGRALLLFLAAAGLFAYRLHHKPPLVSLLQSTARSQLVQSILTPLVRNLENDLQRTMALAASKPEPPPDQVRAGDPNSSNDNLWPKNDEDSNNVEEDQDAVTVAQPSDDMQASADQNANPSDDASQQANGALPPMDGNASPNPSESGDPKQADGNSQSIPQSMMQALKNMMTNTSGQQQTGGRPNQPQQPNSQGAQQSGDSHQSGNSQDDSKNDSRGRSDAQQKSSENSSNGAGNQAGTKELKAGLESHRVKAVPDRVALAASGFKDPTRVRNATDTGTSGIATSNATPQAVTAINGAEQEDIPARYRLYVQHYFEHADKSDTDTGQQ